MFLKSYSRCSACLTNVGLVAILTWYLVDTFTDVLWSVLVFEMHKQTTYWLEWECRGTTSVRPALVQLWTWCFLSSCVIHWIQMLSQPIYTVLLDDFHGIIYIAFPQLGFAFNWNWCYGTRQPVRPETERRTAIRQTDPKKASVEAETSTLI